MMKTFCGVPTGLHAHRVGTLLRHETTEAHTIFSQTFSLPCPYLIAIWHKHHMKCRLARVVISTMRPALADIFIAVSVLNSSILQEASHKQGIDDKIFQFRSSNEKKIAPREDKKNIKNKGKGSSGKKCSAAGPPGAPQPRRKEHHAE